MEDRTAATILADAGDRPLVDALTAGLRELLPGFRIEVGDAGRPDAIVASDPGVVVVLATPALVVSAQYPRLMGMLASAGTVRRRILLTRNVEISASSQGGWELVDVSGWNGHSADGSLRMAARLISSNASPRLGGTSDMPLLDTLLGKVDELPFTARTKTLLRNDNMIHVGDLVSRTEAEMLRLPDFGRKSLNDVKERLGDIGLRLGMDLPEWPPTDFDVATFQMANARRVAKLSQIPGGAVFEPIEDRFVMRTAGDEDDAVAARRPMTQQLQAAALDKARTFAGLAARLDNQPGWTGIARSASALVDLLDRPPRDIPDVLGIIYPTSLELGSFLELDQRLAAGTDSFAVPLDPEMRRPLGDLIRTVAPWLRAFPSIRQADDDASRFLLEVSELQPTSDVVRSAHDHALLTNDDLEVFRQLRDAAERGAFQGGKAAGRAKRSALNLVIGVAVFASGAMMDAVISDYATTSPLAHKAGQFLSRTEVAIGALVADMPSDLRHAIVDFSRGVEGAPLFPASPVKPVPLGPRSSPNGRPREDDG
jgi:hypothetical protein